VSTSYVIVLVGSKPSEADKEDDIDKFVSFVQEGSRVLSGASLLKAPKANS